METTASHNPSREEAKQLTITLNTAEDDNRPVYIVGNFNNWRTRDAAYRLQHKGNGLFEFRFPDVRKLNDEDIEIIKDVLRSFNSSGRTARSTKLVERAAGVVKSKMGVSTDSNNVSFLRTVVKDYNHYAGNLASEEW